MVQESFKELLKERTKDLHDRIENTPIAKALASSSVRSKAYKEYLQKLLAIHIPVESIALANKEQWQKYGIEIEQHCRTSMLEDDLKALGIMQKPQGVLACEDWGFAKIVGALYVLEGSTMGGQILRERLSYIKGDDGLSATRYFGAYKEKTIPQWLHFSRFIDRYAAENKEESALVYEGAKTIYLAVEEAMHSIDSTKSEDAIHQ